MKKIFLFPVSILLVTNTVTEIKSQSAVSNSIYDYKTKTIDGKDYDFAALKGKKVLIVNTASLCGNTPQYKELEELFEKYGDDKFVIIGFPANNFGEQEPGSNTEIKQFCTKNYGVKFPMMSKISVKGADMDPIYHWLTEKRLNGNMDSEVKWNFQKYLISADGKLVAVVDPKTKPMSETIVNWLNGSN